MYKMPGCQKYIVTRDPEMPRWPFLDQQMNCLCYPPDNNNNSPIVISPNSGYLIYYGRRSSGSSSHFFQYMGQ